MCFVHMYLVGLYSTYELHPFNKSPAIQHFERGIAIKTGDGITFNTYTRLPHISPIHPFPYPRESGSNDAERTP